MKHLKNRIFLLFFLLALFFLISFSTKAQFHFEGKVFNAETGLPVHTFVIQTDSTEILFTSSIFHVQSNSFPKQLRVKAEGYQTFRFSDFQTKMKLNIYLIPENVNVQEVIVKAFQSDKRLINTPGSIDLITNRQLLREPAFTFAPSVNKMPGVWMQSGSINTNRLTIRGIGTRSPYGSNKIRAYYGDIPLTNGVGETTLEDLDIEQIADIEIVKGPSSGFYGSGLGGVVV